MDEHGKELATPGSFYDVLQNTSEPLPAADHVAASFNQFIEEYRVLKKTLNLEMPVILYPACGSDVSLSEVFPQSHTYYVDIDTNDTTALRQAGLPKETTHIITQSAYNFEPPEPIDLAVLRNASTDEHDVVDLIRGLREGGYVVESHWGSSSGARELLTNPNYTLVGRLEIDKKDKEKVTLNTNVEVITRRLKEDTDFISKEGGYCYVFQKNTYNPKKPK